MEALTDMGTETCDTWLPVSCPVNIRLKYPAVHAAIVVQAMSTPCCEEDVRNTNQIAHHGKCIRASASALSRGDNLPDISADAISQTRARCDLEL